MNKETSDRLEAYKATWQSMTKASKFFVVALIVIGVLQILIGGVLMCGT